jgi:divalent metal cation (Fe/Co/Zn/Cd) transporter
MLFSMLLTFALVQFQKYAVRRTNSVALAAD